MLRWIDRSERISRLIQWLSRTLSARRGLPVVIAVVLTLLSGIVHVIYIVSAQNPVVGLCGFGLLHLAMLIGFLGVLLAEPLGRG
jgi:lipid-A-disaccharide synthase-like uncharacterized protein